VALGAMGSSVAEARGALVAFAQSTPGRSIAGVVSEGSGDDAKIAAVVLPYKAVSKRRTGEIERSVQPVPAAAPATAVAPTKGARTRQAVAAAR
jgi:hypothetical protein